LRVSHADIVGLRQRLAWSEIYLIVAKIEVEAERCDAIARRRLIESERADVVGAFRREACG
jgi:hypothetical protein